MLTIDAVLTQWKSVPRLPEVQETEFATEPYEDWSGCRSQARARRRAKLGYPQRIVIRRKPAAYQVGETIYIHPEIGRRLRSQMSRTSDEMIANVMMGMRWRY